MTNPTRQEIIDAHQTLRYLCDCLEAEWKIGATTIKDSKSVIEKALPPRPRPTMDEIAWDDEKHYLAEADHPGWGKVIMLGISEEKLIDVFIPHLRKSNCIVPRGNLTPTGRRYTLTEVQE